MYEFRVNVGGRSPKHDRSAHAVLTERLAARRYCLDRVYDLSCVSG